MVGKVEQVQARRGIPSSLEIHILGAQPDLNRRVDNRLIEVAAHDPEVGSAEGHMQMQEGLTVPD